MKWLDNLNRKFCKYAVKHLMSIIVIGMGVVFLFDLLLFNEFASAGGIFSGGMTGLLRLDRDLILSGQVWRLITFVFIPPPTSPLFAIFAFYFYWMVGRYLELEWGAFRFGFYYFCGMLGTIAGGFIAGGATNTYLNLSLLFAFAMFFPNFQILFFFMIPLKIKWLALANGVVFAVTLVINMIRLNFTEVSAILASLLNFLIFFGPSCVNGTKNFLSRKRRRGKYDSSVRWGDKQNKDYWQNR